jgi:predicted Co/Zn/Cd cation transporter (cation efflux family)
MTEPRREKTPTSRKRNMVAVDGALALISCLLVVQMWLLTASLEEYLSGRRETAIPAAIISALLFFGCLALYLFVRRLEVRARQRGL